MFGVVLWSDSHENKAVIWCEDHGDLAFYRQPGDGAHVPLDAGDWVQFDLTTDRHMRLAHNPRLISEGVCQGLADVLGAAAPDTANTRNPGATAAHPRGSADIIPFSLSRRSGHADRSVAAAHRA